MLVIIGCITTTWNSILGSSLKALVHSHCNSLGEAVEPFTGSMSLEAGFNCYLSHTTSCLLSACAYSWSCDRGVSSEFPVSATMHACPLASMNPCNDEFLSVWNLGPNQTLPSMNCSHDDILSRQQKTKTSSLFLHGCFHWSDFLLRRFWTSWKT